MMPRAKGRQSKHDKEVRRLANELVRAGYDVKADILGFMKPDVIGGYRPDIVAWKGSNRKIVEVETADSVNSSRDVAQYKAFRRAADRSKNTTFKRVVVK